MNIFSQELGKSGFLQFDSVHNFRDYGGYKTASGGRMVSGRLYRSGSFSKVSKSDIERLAVLNLQAFIDLRGASERAKDLAIVSDIFSKPVFCSDGETAVEAPLVAPHLEGIDADKSASEIRKEMIKRYADMPFRTYLTDVYQKYFKVLATSSDPSAVFCTAGKDRTGLLVAIMQTLLGVHRDDVLEEFLLTNVAPGQEARIEAIREELYVRFGAGLSEEAVAVVAGVEVAFLDSALSAMVESHGSVDAYAKDILQLDSKMYDALVANFTE